MPGKNLNQYLPFGICRHKIISAHIPERGGLILLV